MPTTSGKTLKSGGKTKKDDPGKKGSEQKASGSKGTSDVQEIDTLEKGDVKVDPNAFQIAFYMKHFRVTDIIVKVANKTDASNKVVERTLIIDASHREHADEHGLVSRSMLRKQKLPMDVNVKTLGSAFTGSGFLVIYAERLKETAS